MPLILPYDNYDDVYVWNTDFGGELYFISEDANAFPRNRKTSYTLQRESDDKVYPDYFFNSYDEENDNLIFRKYNGDSFDYCTVSDLDLWDMEANHVVLVN